MWGYSCGILLGVVGYDLVGCCMGKEFFFLVSLLCGALWDFPLTLALLFDGLCPPPPPNLSFMLMVWC